jgi:hypothetical protein
MNAIARLTLAAVAVVALLTSQAAAQPFRPAIPRGAGNDPDAKDRQLPTPWIHLIPHALPGAAPGSRPPEPPYPKPMPATVPLEIIVPRATSKMPGTLPEVSAFRPAALEASWLARAPGRGILAGIGAAIAAAFGAIFGGWRTSQANWHDSLPQADRHQVCTEELRLGVKGKDGVWIR